MRDNALSQFASTASVEALAGHFSQYVRQDQERSDLTIAVLKRLHSCEEEIQRLKMDLEDQTKSRKIYQREAYSLDEQNRKAEHLIAKDPYVVVLIDGDGSKFLDELLQDPVSGATTAAHRLSQEIKSFLKDTPLGDGNLPILVRVFANLNDLAKSLRLSNVIASADDMRMFAEQFTISRAEFDFINVGRGKENADSKMRKMLNHFLNNFQCKKIFFAGCHDNGYLHDIKEHAGDLDAKQRIVLLETTPAEPGFLTLGFPIIRFDSVFRSEPLANERKTYQSLPSRPAQSPVLLEKLAEVAQYQPPESPATVAPAGSPLESVAIPSVRPSAPTPSVSTSSNGGISVKYPSSYAAAGGASGHQNISIQAAKPKNPKIIYFNEKENRIDPQIKSPNYTSPAQASYKAKAEKIKPAVFCNQYYLANNCELGDECDREHATKLLPAEIAIHRFRARTSVCPTGHWCTDFDCCLSHHCPYPPPCTRPECKFKNSRHGDLHFSKEDMVVTKRWVEGEDFPVRI